MLILNIIQYHCSFNFGELLSDSLTAIFAPKPHS